MTRFQQKVVVITGAGSGIGAGAAQRFAREGASVVLVGRTPEKLEKVAAQLPQGKHLVVPCDVSSADEVQNLAQRVIDRARIQRHHRLARGLLVGGGLRGVHRQRVGLRRGGFLLDQAAEDAGFDRVEWRRRAGFVHGCHPAC